MSMRIGVVGAGGVGGLLSGLLSRAGHDVALVARGRALEQIREHGLRVDSPLGGFSAKLEVADSVGELAPVDVALLAVKTWQVQEVAASIGPWLREGGCVVPLQNGVDAVEECETALGKERVIGGFCRMLSWIAEPGAIKHVGESPVVTLDAWGSNTKDTESRRDPRAERLQAALESAGVVVRSGPDFSTALWEKFLFIAAFGGVGALSRSTAGLLLRTAETRSLLVGAFEEVRAVAHAKGIALPAGIVASTLAYVETLPEGATASLQRDILAGRPSELKHLSGAVARIGASLDVPVPIHRTIYAALLPLDLAARKGG
jgi:2-dehydropantoate 2-reductase